MRADPRSRALLGPEVFEVHRFDSCHPHSRRQHPSSFKHLQPTTSVHASGTWRMSENEGKGVSLLEWMPSATARMSYGTCEPLLRCSVRLAESKRST
eukprot:1172087-Rhodomonas_salina.1